MNTGTAMKTVDIVKQVEQMAELARIGQDFLEVTAYFSEETIKAMINDAVKSGNTHLISRWPSSLFAAIK